MSNRQPKYLLGGISFTSQEAVKKHAASLRTLYPRSATITDTAHIAFLIDLIEGHVERDDKIGPGIARFYWTHAPDHPSDCFYLERVDKSYTDFGVLACLSGVGAIARINRQSLRMAIKPDLDEYRRLKLGDAEMFISEYSGKSFPASQAVVDHVKTFEEILAEFFQPIGILLSETLLTRSTDLQSNPVWQDVALLKRFLSFHRKFPLRLVQWRENVSEITKNNNIRFRETAAGDNRVSPAL